MSNMANQENVQAAFDMIRNGLMRLEASFTKLETDAAFGREVRALRDRGKPGIPTRKPVSSANGINAGAKTKSANGTKTKARPKNVAKAVLATKVLDALRDKKDGVLTKDLGEAVGASGDELYQVVKGLRKQKKITKRGTTSQTRYFLAKS